MDENKIQEAIEFYEAFKKCQTHQKTNDAIRAERNEMVEKRVNANPRLANLYNSMECGLAKSAEEQRAKKEQAKIDLTRKQQEEQSAKRASIEKNSGWLWDAVKRKRGQ